MGLLTGWDAEEQDKAVVVLAQYVLWIVVVNVRKVVEALSPAD